MAQDRRRNLVCVRGAASLSKKWLWRPSHSVTLSPLAAYRFDGDLAYDARFFLNWGEDATSDSTDTLVGP